MARGMLTLALALLLSGPAFADDGQATLAEARGQTVYWNAWGGDEQINDYIAWVGDGLQERHGVEVIHVKLTDTAEAVARVLAEKAAGRTAGGAVDLIWINGENFAAMKAEDLLFGPFVERLPNFAHVDTVGKPTTLVDFTVPTDGLEAPWGMAQFVFFTTPRWSRRRRARSRRCSTGPGRTPAASPIRRRPTSSARPSSSMC